MPSASVAGGNLLGLVLEVLLVGLEKGVLLVAIVVEGFGGLARLRFVIVRL